MADIRGLNLPPEILAKLAELDLELSEGRKLQFVLDHYRYRMNVSLTRL
jgi:hypothetical protein